MKNIVVIGLGYTGAVTAACFAKHAHVTSVDINPDKVKLFNEGKASFYEPGLNDLLALGLRNKSLSAVLDGSDGYEQALLSADFIIVCVGTPLKDGEVDASIVKSVVDDIRIILQHTQKAIIVIRSTVFPGTCESLGVEKLVMFPEFLREGSAISDFQNPPITVVGTQNEEYATELLTFLFDTHAEYVAKESTVSLRTAEMLKFACNAYHALKIVFANEIAAVSDAFGADGRKVMQILCRDRVLNCSPAYLKPGFAFGGSCLPKDVNGLVTKAYKAEIDIPLLSNIMRSNDYHLFRIRNTILQEVPEDKIIGVIGLAFKENTDDTRNSPAVALVHSLREHNRKVITCDKLVSILNPDYRSIVDLIDSSDVLVVPYKLNKEDDDLVMNCGKPVIQLY